MLPRRLVFIYNYEAASGADAGDTPYASAVDDLASKLGYNQGDGNACMPHTIHTMNTIDKLNDLAGDSFGNPTSIILIESFNFSDKSDRRVKSIVEKYKKIYAKLQQIDREIHERISKNFIKKIPVAADENNRNLIDSEQDENENDSLIFNFDAKGNPLVPPDFEPKYPWMFIAKSGLKFELVLVPENSSFDAPPITVHFSEYHRTMTSFRQALEVGDCSFRLTGFNIYHQNTVLYVCSRILQNVFQPDILSDVLRTYQRQLGDIVRCILCMDVNRGYCYFDSGDYSEMDLFAAWMISRSSVIQNEGIWEELAHNGSALCLPCGLGFALVIFTNVPSGSHHDELLNISLALALFLKKYFAANPVEFYRKEMHDPLRAYKKELKNKEQAN